MECRRRCTQRDPLMQDKPDPAGFTCASPSCAWHAVIIENRELSNAVTLLACQAMFSPVHQSGYIQIFATAHRRAKINGEKDRKYKIQLLYVNWHTETVGWGRLFAYFAACGRNKQANTLLIRFYDWALADWQIDDYLCISIGVCHSVYASVRPIKANISDRFVNRVAVESRLLSSTTKAIQWT